MSFLTDPPDRADPDGAVTTDESRRTPIAKTQGGQRRKLYRRLRDRVRQKMGSSATKLLQRLLNMSERSA